MSKFFERFIQWQNYMHYFLNSALLLGEFYIFKLYENISFSGFWSMLFLITALIFINDTTIHALFWYAKKPFQWRD